MLHVGGEEVEEGASDDGAGAGLGRFQGRIAPGDAGRHAGDVVPAAVDPRQPVPDNLLDRDPDLALLSPGRARRNRADA